jgi:hypothetical protein
MNAMQVDEQNDNLSVSMSSNGSIGRTRTNSDSYSTPSSSDLSDLDDDDDDADEEEIQDNNGADTNCKSLLFAPKNYLIQYSHHRQHLKNPKNVAVKKVVSAGTKAKKSLYKRSENNNNNQNESGDEADSNSSDSDPTSDIEDEEVGAGKPRKTTSMVNSTKYLL